MHMKLRFSHPGDADFVPDASGEPSASSSAGTPSTSAGDKTGSVDSAPADVTMKEGSAADAELPSSAAEPAVSALAAAPAGLAAGDVSAPTVPEAKAPPEELHAPPAIPDALPSKHSEAPAGAKESRRLRTHVSACWPRPIC